MEPLSGRRDIVLLLFFAWLPIVANYQFIYICGRELDAGCHRRLRVNVKNAMAGSCHTTTAVAPIESGACMVDLGARLNFGHTSSWVRRHNERSSVASSIAHQHAAKSDVWSLSVSCQIQCLVAGKCSPNLTAARPAFLTTIPSCVIASVVVRKI